MEFRFLLVINNIVFLDFPCPEINFYHKLVWSLHDFYEEGDCVLYTFSLAPHFTLGWYEWIRSLLLFSRYTVGSMLISPLYYFCIGEMQLSGSIQISESRLTFNWLFLIIFLSWIFEKFFNVPHLLWHGPTLYNGHLQGPVTLASIVERLAVKLSQSVLTTLVCPDQESNPDLPHY